VTVVTDQEVVGAAPDYTVGNVERPPQPPAEGGEPH